MSYDEQPDGDIHGECAVEIKRLQTENESMKTLIEEIRESMSAMIKSDWRKWEEASRPEECLRLAKNKANHIVHKCDAMLLVVDGDARRLEELITSQ